MTVSVFRLCSGITSIWYQRIIKLKNIKNDGRLEQLLSNTFLFEKCNKDLELNEGYFRITEESI